MRPARRALPAIVSGAVALVVVAVLFTSALFVLALVAPFVGVWLSWQRVKAAASLWRSDGRLPVGNELHIIEPERARRLALADFGTAAGIVIASMVPALWLFVSFGAAVVTGVASAVVFSFARSARTRLVAGARPVEVLPPDDHRPFG